MSVEELTTQLATAKTAHKANKADAGLKKAYKAAKAALAAGVAAAEAKAAKKAAKKAKKASKRKAEAPAEEAAEEPAKKQKTDPQATLKEAKAAYKANKGDAALKAAYKAAKKAAEAAPVAEEAPAEAPVDDLMASLKKKKTEAPAASGNAGLSGPPPSADHEGNPPSEKIFAGNLSFDIDEDAAKKWFEECGAITDIHWLEDRDSGKFKGCGFITFESVEAAAKAVAKNGEDCMGREIRLNYAKPRAAGGGGKGGGKSRPLSEKPEGCTTVFAGNLSFDIDDDKMREFASDCGEVKNIRWLTDRDSGDFKGCGFIEFFDGAGVDQFVKKNGESLLGRNIRLDYAAPRAPRD